MAKSIEFTDNWADGSYTFRLNLPQLEEHDEKCAAGPIAVLGPLIESLPYALAILSAAINGNDVEAVEPGKEEAAKSSTEADQTASISPQSDEMHAQSGSENPT